MTRTEFLSVASLQRNRISSTSGYTHLSSFCSLPCRTDRWYSIEFRFAAAVLRSFTLSWFAARWVFVDRSVRGAVGVESIVYKGADFSDAL